MLYTEYKKSRYLNDNQTQDLEMELMVQHARWFSKGD